MLKTLDAQPMSVRLFLLSLNQVRDSAYNQNEDPILLCLLGSALFPLFLESSSLGSTLPIYISSISLVISPLFFLLKSSTIIQKKTSTRNVYASLSARDTYTQKKLFYFHSKYNAGGFMSLRLLLTFFKLSSLHSALACLYTSSTQDLQCLCLSSCLEYSGTAALLLFKRDCRSSRSLLLFALLQNEPTRVCSACTKMAPIAMYVRCSLCSKELITATLLLSKILFDVSPSLPSLPQNELTTLSLENLQRIFACLPFSLPKRTQYKLNLLCLLTKRLLRLYDVCKSLGPSLAQKKRLIYLCVEISIRRADESPISNSDIKFSKTTIYKSSISKILRSRLAVTPQYITYTCLKTLHEAPM